jgi:hypothetical protein
MTKFQGTTQSKKLTGTLNSTSFKQSNTFQSLKPFNPDKETRVPFQAVPSFKLREDLTEILKRKVK